MKDIQQLIKKNSQEGRYEDIFPKTFIDAVEDRESGNNLNEILSGFNMYFLSYNGSRELTKLQVPMSIRKTGLWITYVLYDKTVVTEWYAGEAIDDDSWKNLDNWRVGSNMLVGDISISSDGYWVVNGVITTTKAQGEQGITPMLRVGSNNHLQVSYTNGSSWVDASTNPVYTQFRINNNKLEQSVNLGQTWTVVSDYIASWFRFTGTTGSSQADNVGKIQISRDNGVTWSDLSGEFTNSLHIKGYVATVGALPSSAVQGDIYGVGPTYDPSDTTQTNPIYQLYVKDSTGWVNNGKFTSIAAGVVQTTGTSTTEVMSQNAVTTELDSLRSDLNENISFFKGEPNSIADTLIQSIKLIKYKGDDKDFYLYYIKKTETTISIYFRYGGSSFNYVSTDLTTKTERLAKYAQYPAIIKIAINPDLINVGEYNLQNLYLKDSNISFIDGKLNLGVNPYFKNSLCTDIELKVVGLIKSVDISEYKGFEFDIYAINVSTKAITLRYVSDATRYITMTMPNNGWNTHYNASLKIEISLYLDWGALDVGVTSTNILKLTISLLAYHRNNTTNYVENTLNKFSVKKWDGYCYNQGNGVLEYGPTTRYGTSLILAKAGDIYRILSDIEPSLYCLFFDKDRKFIKSVNVTNDYLAYKVFKTVENTGYIAFTATYDFDSILFEKVSVNENNPLKLDYITNRNETRSRVPKYLREKGLIISFVENGVPVLEQFTQKNGQLVDTNYFQQNVNWVEIATSESMKGMSKHPMAGKTFYCIGDSLRWRWCSKMADLTGSTWGGDIFDSALNLYERYYQSRLIAQAKKLVDIYDSGGAVDYIFIEYVHSYFTNNVDAVSSSYGYSGGITEAEPFLTQAFYEYNTQTFNNGTEAKAFWDANLATIVSQYSPKSNAIICFKVERKVQSPRVKLSGTVTTEGEFTIKFTDSLGTEYAMAIGIDAGMTLEQAMTTVNEIEFADSGCKWDNLEAHSIVNDGVIKFTYVGNNSDADSSIKVSYDFGTTGLSYDGDWDIVSELTDWIRGFHSHDVSEWSNPLKWNDLASNFDSYKWCKAMIELIQKYIPFAKIVIFTMPFDMWDYTTNISETGANLLYADGTFNVQALYNSDRHKRVEQNWKGWETVAKYYNTMFVNVGNINCISPINYPSYYSSNNVHPYQIGYDKVAEIIANSVY